MELPSSPSPDIGFKPKLLLATDLDGTFLGGDPEHKRRLYRLISQRDDIGLVYVTGRGLERVLPLLGDPTLPIPDFIICDVGATVVEGANLHPVQPLQSEIQMRWPGEQRIADALEDWPGIERQDQPQERRVSFYCEPGAVTDALHERVQHLGCDLLYSAGLYLDVLPPGVNKGSTLEALVQLLQLDHASVLVAGDTLNDLSMYTHGFNGVCVGESEPELLGATRDLEHVLHAQQAGAGGIVEAMRHFRMLESDALEGIVEERRRGKAELVMVYHRLPYEEYVEDGVLKRRRHTSPNGIIPTLLSFFAEGRKGSWVAWTLDDADRPGFEKRTNVHVDRYPNLTASRVALSSEQVDIFYKRFSKEAFWPLLHTFWERARFREDHWQVFLEVNRMFAEHAAAEAAEGATVWIHDYNLWMVPAFLREQRPDVRIAFFHHTYFPSADVFNVVPWRREIVGSLLACDYVAFHIPRQSENFIDVVRGSMPMETLETRSCAPQFLTYGCALGLDRMTTRIRTGGREVRLGAHPVGISLDRIKHALRQDEVVALRQRIAEAFRDRKLVLSVERLDFTKGTLEKLQAMELMLERQPELHERISLVVVCVPAAKEMQVYDELQQEIEGAVGRINGRFSKVGWVPVQFFFRPLPFEQVVGYYAEADVMWITPLRDGLNLVAKEFAAAQGLTRGDGVLVLSEFAGAAVQLKGALLTNPHDVNDLAAVCLQALNMPRQERRDRIRTLADIVRHHDVRRWGEEFLDAVEATGTATPQE